MKNSMLKFAAFLGIVGGFLTFVEGITATWDFHIDPHGWIANTWFTVGMVIELPGGAIVARWLGVPESASRAEFIFLQVATNTILCSLVGAFIGGFAWLVSARREKANGSDGTAA